MKKIYKYELPIGGMSIEINDYVLEWLKVDVQNGWPHIWAVVDTEREGMMTEIVAWGTGWILPDDVYYDTDYLGTAVDGAGYVWHYFAKTHPTEYTPLTNKLTTQEYTLYANGDWGTISSADDYYVDGYSNCTISTINPTTAVTFTVDNVNFDKLIEKVEKHVADSMTVTNRSVQ